MILSWNNLTFPNSLQSFRLSEFYFCFFTEIMVNLEGVGTKFRLYPLPIHSRDMTMSLMSNFFFFMSPIIPALVRSSPSDLLSPSLGMWSANGRPLDLAATFMLFRALSVFPTDTNHLEIFEKLDFGYHDLSEPNNSHLKTKLNHIKTHDVSIRM